MLSRRELLIAAGASALTLSLSGCGGGGGGASGTTTPTADRPEPGGSAANQLLMFSSSADALSLMGLGSLPDPLPTAAPVRAIESEFAGLHAAAKAGFRANLMARLQFEEVCSSIIELDSLGYLGDQVSALNGLVGAGSLSNPQWLAAMFERQVAALRIAASMNKHQQTSMLGPLFAAVRATPPGNQRLLAYAVAVYCFNNWVRQLCAEVNVPLQASWLGSDSSGVTESMVESELTKMESTLPLLPLGPGFRPGGTGATSSIDVMQLFNAWKDATTHLDLSGSMFQLFFTDTDKRLVNWISSPASSGSKLQKNLSDDSRINSLLKSLKSSLGSSVYLDACTAFVTGQFTTAVTAWTQCMGLATLAHIGFRPVLAGGVPGLGWTSMASIGINDRLTTYFDCSLLWQNVEISQALSHGDAIASSYQEGGLAIPGRTLPALTNPSSAECDQLAAAAVSKATVSVPASKRPQAEARRHLLGYRTLAADTRVYKDLLDSASSLLWDYLDRHPAVLNPTIGAGTAEFFRSDLALLIRREPGATQAEVPTITSAQLLCSSPGFVPMRTTDPKDLSILDNLPELQPASSLGTGVIVDVR